ncbi:S1C family serine protease [Galactobacter caseinivorans]|uniref:PDZ domain-containing protein n=1 Tax=Galactobacter caseinivorans TaxID=2676123 RepID=A0A496PJ46_9MICC|nr:trypsin-like peptidase domain-containing protein [Galactobacter caseinivorans]RKW70524.1 PDZ domain-containing protein [Galactobacter caseinivorans]
MNEQFPQVPANGQQPAEGQPVQPAQPSQPEQPTQRIEAPQQPTTQYPSVHAPSGPAPTNPAPTNPAPSDPAQAGHASSGSWRQPSQAHAAHAQPGQQPVAWGHSAWDRAPQSDAQFQQSAPQPGMAGAGGAGGPQDPYQSNAWQNARQPSRRRGLKYSLAAGALALAVVAGAVPGWALGHSAGSTEASSQTQTQPGSGFGQNQTQNGQGFGQGNGSTDGSTDGSDGSDGSSGDGQQYNQMPFNRGDGSNGSNGSNGSEPGGTSGSSVQQGSALKSGQDGMVLIDTVVGGGQGAGTGMILSEDGYVLTNYHVVEGSSEVRVTDTTTGKEYTGEVVGHDETQDVALVKLKDASGLKVVQTASTGVKEGDEVSAIGNASGEGYLRQLTGKVTATEQSITTQAEASSDGEKLSNLIQTDADVVPGYSGGALVNGSGQVVGMTTAASTGRTSENVDGYAIPISEALKIADQIKSGQASGTVQIGKGAALGISVLSADTGQVGGGYGVTVQEVIKGGAVTGAGIKTGDTIIGLDGKSVKSYDALKEILAGHKAGDQVELVWLNSEGKQSSKTVTLGESSVN